jgi:hypothetical protein
MQRQAIQPPVKAFWTIVALLIVSAALAGSQGPSSEAEKDKRGPDKGADAGEPSRREAERVIRGIDLEILSDGKWTEVGRIEKPLLFYTDPTRENDQGSVWGWGRKGRPVALLELFHSTTERTKWVFAICNTSGGKLRARRAGAPWWGANDSATQLEDVPGASVPAADSLVRQRQLNLLAQKFTGHEFWDPANSRYELRLLKRPLYTYQDEASGVLEGGLFTLANGTNPEIMVFVEARIDPKDRSKSVWQYAVGRSAHAELHLEYAGKEVFAAPRGDKVSASNRPYWLGVIDAPVDGDVKKP